MSYLLAAGVVVIGILSALWQYAESRLDTEQKARAVAEASVKSFAAGLTQCRAEIAEKNALINRFQSLPVDRLRRCVTRGPQDACCKSAPAPPATDECKP